MICSVWYSLWMCPLFTTTATKVRMLTIFQRKGFASLVAFVFYFSVSGSTFLTSKLDTFVLPVTCANAIFFFWLKWCAGYGYATVVEVLSTALCDGTTSPYLGGVDKETGKKIPMVRASNTFSIASKPQTPTDISSFPKSIAHLTNQLILHHALLWLVANSRLDISS